MQKTLSPDHGAQFGDERIAFTTRLGLFYGALFLIYGVHLPYLPIWLDWRGLDSHEIAAITATPFFLRVLITPSAAMLADQYGNHSQMSVWLAWAALAFALLLSQTSAFWPIFLTAIPFAIAVSTIMPLTETIACAGVRAANLDYGRMRLWGSLTFVAVGFLGGWLIDRLGASAAIWLVVGGALATALASKYLPDGYGELSNRVEAPRRRVSADDAKRLVQTPLFLVFLLAAGAVQGAHGMFYTFGALHWRAQGISTVWIGTLWAMGVGCEVLLFAYSGAVVRHFGAPKLLVAASAAAVLRWTLMSFNPPLALLIPVQMLHGLTYGASHLGAIHFISKAVPEGAQGTAQACYATVAAGLLMGGATLLAGLFYARAGGLAYLAMAALGAIGLVASVIVQRRWGGGQLWQEKKL